MTSLTMTQTSSNGVEMQTIPLINGTILSRENLLTYESLRMERDQVSPFLHDMDTEELVYLDMEERSYDFSNPKTYTGRKIISLVAGGSLALIPQGLAIVGLTESLALGAIFEIPSLIGSAGALLGAYGLYSKNLEFCISSNPDIKKYRLDRLRSKIEAIDRQIESNASSEIEQTQMQMVKRIFSNTILHHSNHRE